MSYHRNPIWNKDKLIKGIKKFYKVKNRAPYQSDLSLGKYKYLPKSFQPGHRLFGSWVNAIKAAEIELENCQRKQWTKQELISSFLDYVKKTNIMPTGRRMRTNPIKGLPSHQAYTRVFKNLHNFYVTSGILTGNCSQCGYNKYTEIHHINKNGADDRLENLSELCPNCHVLIHRLNFKFKLKSIKNNIL